MNKIDELLRFEVICLEYGFEYDFTKKGSYYTSWEPSQAFALYNISVEIGRNEQKKK
jgi:hypothetical protein